MLGDWWLLEGRGILSFRDIGGRLAGVRPLGAAVRTSLPPLEVVTAAVRAGTHPGLGQVRARPDLRQRITERTVGVQFLFLQQLVSTSSCPYSASRGHYGRGACMGISVIISIVLVMVSDVLDSSGGGSSVSGGDMTPLGRQQSGVHRCSVRGDTDPGHWAALTYSLYTVELGSNVTGGLMAMYQNWGGGILQCSCMFTKLYVYFHLPRI